jgi:hypothetical protein
MGRESHPLVVLFGLSILVALISCGHSAESSPKAKEDPQSALLRAMSEAHAGLEDSEDGETDLSAFEDGLAPGDFGRFEGERRCLLEHFGEDLAARQQAEERLLALWGVRAEWAETQRHRVADSPDRLGVSNQISQQRYEQVCPGGKASTPFRAQLGL